MKLIMALPPPELDEELPEPDPPTYGVDGGPRVRTGHFGDFDLLGKIGEGGMGVIYRARERRLNRIVALKLIKGGSLATPADIDRFRTEAAAAALLEHPHIVRVYGASEFLGQHYYSMQFVSGRSLAEKLRTGPLAPKLAARLLQKVAQAIELAHENGILHRDLKPANILMDEAEEPRVADFGLAKNLKSQSEHSIAGTVMGSPHYMPPEQAEGRSGDVTFRSDVYSLGAILYDMLTGRPPFSGATPLDTMRLVVDKEPVAPRALNPAVPLDLETICLKCLAKDPKRRYATARELAEELDRYLEGVPINARPVSALERGWRWCKRNPIMAGLAAGVAIAPMVVIGVMYFYGQQIAAESRRLAAQTYGADMALADRALADRALADRDFGAANWALASYTPAARAGINSPGAPGFEWRWLWQKAQGEALRTIPAHQGKVTSVTFSPDGQLLVSGSDDGLAMLWDVSRDWRLRTIVPSPASGGEVAATSQGGISPSFTADGKRLLVGDPGGLAMWSLRDWQQCLNFGSNHIGSPICSPTDTNLVAALLTQTNRARRFLALFDLAAGQFIKSFSGQDVQYFCFTPDGEKLAYWDYHNSNEIVIQPVRGEKPPVVIPIHCQDRTVMDMAFTKDGQTLLLGWTLPGGIDLYDVPNRSLLKTLPGGMGRLGAIAISADNQWLAAGGADQSIYLWDLPNRRRVRRLWGHAGTVSALAFSPDCRQLFSGGWDGTLRIWDLTPAPPPPRLTNVVDCFAFSVDGRLLVTQGTNGMARLWELPGRTMLDEWRMPNFQSAVFGPGGKLILAGNSQPSNLPCIWKYDLASKTLGKPLLLEDIGWPCTAVTLSPDGEFLATGYRSGVVALWQAGDGIKLYNSQRGLGEGSTRYAVTGLSFSSDQRRLVAFSKRGSSLIAAAWDIPGWSWSGLHPFSGAENKFTLSPDGEHFALSGKDQPLGIKNWKSAGKKNEVGLQGNVGIPSALAFSADGRTLASGEDDGLIKLWHLDSKRAVATLGTANSTIIMSDLLFSRDGTWLGMSDKTGELHLFHAPVPSPAAGSAVP